MKTKIHIKKDKKQGGEKMFYQFRDVIKGNDARGWRLEKEDEQFFLSKFDDAFNDNEIRVYIDFKPEGIHIKKSVKIKNYSKIIELDATNKYVQKAIELCQSYDLKNHRQTV